MGFLSIWMVGALEEPFFFSLDLSFPFSRDGIADDGI